MARQAAEPTADRLLLAATLASAPVDFLGFLLPLWAAAQLDASPGQVGAVLSVAAAAAFCARPVAGVLADRTQRNRVAAAGAALYALAFAGYAAASTPGHLFAAAPVQGIAGALFWVAVRAHVGETTEGGSRSYGRLLAAESRGAFLGFFVGFLALDRLGYRGIFLLAAAACALAALLLLREPPVARVPTAAAPAGMPDLWRRFWPWLGVVFATALADSGVGLLLLLHLQDRFDLAVYQIAWVFLPGALVFVTLPHHAHRVTDRLGPTRTVFLSLLVGAAFALALAPAPNPWTIALLWVLASACFAAAVPVEQLAVADAAGASKGRGLGLYEGAALLGAIAGPALFGALYARAGWPTACATAALVLLAAALAAPFALRSLSRASPSAATS